MGDRSHAVFLDDDTNDLYVNAPHGRRIILKDWADADGDTLVGMQIAH